MPLSHGAPEGGTVLLPGQARKTRCRCFGAQGYDDMVGTGKKGVLGGASPRGDGPSAEGKGLGLHG